MYLIKGIKKLKMCWIELKFQLPLFKFPAGVLWFFTFYTSGKEKRKENGDQAFCDKSFFVELFSFAVKEVPQQQY